MLGGVPSGCQPDGIKHGRGAGPSAATITWPTSEWQAEAKAFSALDLSGVDYVYVWADGIHVDLRLEEDKL